MSTDYEPGTVAIATVCGVKGRRVFRRRDHHGVERWETATNLNGWLGHDDSDVTDIRPLVVLDLAANDLGVLSDAWANVERAMKDGHSLPIIIEHLRDQIEAQTKPPRIPEPGLWGVVQASTEGSRETRMFARGHGGCWVSLSTTCPVLKWDDLVNPVLIREGLS